MLSVATGNAKKYDYSIISLMQSTMAIGRGTESEGDREDHDYEARLDVSARSTFESWTGHLAKVAYIFMPSVYLRPEKNC